MPMKFTEDKSWFMIAVPRREFAVAVQMLCAIRADDKDRLEKLLSYCEDLAECVEEDKKPKLTLVKGDDDGEV